MEMISRKGFFVCVLIAFALVALMSWCAGPASAAELGGAVLGAAYADVTGKGYTGVAPGIIVLGEAAGPVWWVQGELAGWSVEKADSAVGGLYAATARWAATPPFTRAWAFGGQVTHRSLKTDLYDKSGTDFRVLATRPFEGAGVDYRVQVAASRHAASSRLEASRGALFFLIETDVWWGHELSFFLVGAGVRF